MAQSWKPEHETQEWAELIAHLCRAADRATERGDERAAGVLLSTVCLLEAGLGPRAAAQPTLSGIRDLSLDVTPGARALV